ncbi:MAG: hypothetical protein PHT38_08830 [Halothiobacillus sp.]|nr:hypothetical protein [Halothiobacillus sp.]
MTENDINAPTLDEETLKRIKGMMVWSAKDLSWLMLGYDPREAAESRDMYKHSAERNEARAVVDRAITYGFLPSKPGSRADTVFNYGDSVLCDDAIKWVNTSPACEQYRETFPQFSITETHLEETEVKRLQRALGALVLGLARKGGQWESGGKPNISNIVTTATDGVQDASGRAPNGYGKTTLTDTISAALKACQKDMNT